MPVPDSWLAATLAAVAVGAVAVTALTVQGLYFLNPNHQAGRAIRFWAFSAGAAGGGIAVAAAHHVHAPWWWLPSLLAWAVTLVAAAVCDACTQRIPALLVWEGGVLTALLIAAAGLATNDWSALFMSLIGCGIACFLLALCWRFAGMGFGDVRLAAVGGLGLGHVTQRGLTVAVLAFALLAAGQAIWTYARTRDRTARFAYGPALAVGFLVAVAV
jgi:leader peptidase (prepilin peptidase)/N-methyltransferase